MHYTQYGATRFSVLLWCVNRRVCMLSSAKINYSKDAFENLFCFYRICLIRLFGALVLVRFVFTSIPAPSAPSLLSCYFG